MFPIGVAHLSMRHRVERLFFSGFSDKKPVCGTLTVGVCILLIGAPFLAFLAIFDTCRYRQFHLISAIVFFVTGFLFMTLNTVSSRALWKQSLSSENPVRDILGQSYKYQLGIYTFFLINFIIYLPIGLSLQCTVTKLSIAECERHVFTPEKCNQHADLALNETCFDDYSGCVGTNTMRTVTQHLTVLGILLYYAVIAFGLKKFQNLVRSIESSIESSKKFLKQTSL